MTRFCDNCCVRGDFSVEDAITVVPSIGGGTKNEGEGINREVPAMCRLPISEALSSITCTLWGDPASAESEIGPDPLKEGLELCSNCRNLLTLLYNNLQQFRHLCREQGRVFTRILELRKVRRKTETVVSVVKLERLPAPFTSKSSLRKRRHPRVEYYEDDDSLPIVDKLEVEIKEEPCSADEQSDWNFVPDDASRSSKSSSYSTDANFDSDDDDFSIRPCTKETSLSDRIPCPVSDCETTFVRRDNIRKHLRRFHPTEDANKLRIPGPPVGTGQYECDICHQRFLYLSGRGRHIREKHGERISCPVENCEMTFSRKETLRKHAQKVHPNVTVHLERAKRSSYTRIGQYKKKTVKKEAQPPKKKVKPKTKCPHCDKIVYKRHLRDHLTTHSNDRRHLCEQCGKSYKTRTGLRLHIKETHQPKSEDSTIFSCPHCTVTCTRIDSLRRHIEAIHQSKDSSSIFTCEVCGKHFIHERNLKVHAKLHDEELIGKFECSICNKVLSRMDNLRSHMEQMHKIEATPKRDKTLTSVVRPRNTVAKVVSGRSSSGNIQSQGLFQRNVHDNDQGQSVSYAH